MITVLLVLAIAPVIWIFLFPFKTEQDKIATKRRRGKKLTAIEQAIMDQDPEKEKYRLGGS